MTIGKLPAVVKRNVRIMFVMEADSLQALVSDAWLNIGRVGYKYKDIHSSFTIFTPFFFSNITSLGFRDYYENDFSIRVAGAALFRNCGYSAFEKFSTFI